MEAAAQIQFEARYSGAGRKEPEHRFRGHRPGRGGGGRALRAVLQSGPMLLRRIESFRRREDLRPIRGKERRSRQSRTVGDPFDPKTEQGPQVRSGAVRQGHGLYRVRRSEGAKLVCGGKRVGDRGYFIEPTVFADVQDDMKIAQEEIFGPVMSIIPFKNLDEVVHARQPTRSMDWRRPCGRAISRRRTPSQQRAGRNGVGELLQRPGQRLRSADSSSPASAANWVNTDYSSTPKRPLPHAQGYLFRQPGSGLAESQSSPRAQLQLEP